MNDETDTTDPARDDELLSAWLDGELSADAVAGLERRIEREAALAARLAELRAVDRVTQQLGTDLAERPLPPALEQLLGVGNASPERADNVVHMPRRAWTRFFDMPAAIAASVALAVGVTVTFLVRSGPAAPDSIALLAAQPIPAESGLHNLLEQGHGGRDAVLADGANARVILTFENTAGDWCRRLDIGRGGLAVDALACRRDGAWQAELLAFSESASGAYQAASGGSAAMEAALDRLLGDGQPLEPAAENALVERGWAAER